MSAKAPRATQVRTLMNDLWRWMSRWPEGRVVLGIVDLSDMEAGAKVQVEAVDFNAVHWVALADAALGYAATKLTAPDKRDLLLCVERARGELDFEDRAGKRQ